LFQDISKVRIQNLQSATYLDKVDSYTVKSESSSAIAIAQETDRVYQSLDPSVPIIVSSSETDEMSVPLLFITRKGLSDITLWNPWSEKAKGMSDFGDEEYKQMVCVEPGSVTGWQTLDAEDTWEGTQAIRSSRP
jgi:glucose-6-phosphate 1-epimerase